MRGKCSSMMLAVLVAIGLLATATPAGATIGISDGPGPALAALAGPGFTGTAPDFVPISATAAAGIGDTTSNVFPFPRGGSGQFLVLSTGDATLADQPDQPGVFPGVGNGGGHITTPVDRGTTALDVTTFQVTFNGLAAGASCLAFDYRFLSEEYPVFIHSLFNDAFIAELDNTTWTTSGSDVSGLGNDFALDPSGNPVTIKSTGPTSMSPAEAAGTPYGGATAPLHAQVPVPQGATAHNLYLSIFDQQDDDYDTAVFVDNATLTQTTNCPRGSTGLGPAVAITGPAGGSTVQSSTPTLTGTASGPGAVTVRIYTGDVATGAPVQQLTAARSGTSWSATTAALVDGQYTAQATQPDANGINGLSGATTFTVDTSQIQAQQSQQLPPSDRDGDGIPDNLDTNDGSRPPVPGKSVQVRVVSGDVYIKLPKGASGRAAGPPAGFVPLKGAANIPVGSQLDTEDGRVALTSAADTGGAKVQTSDFYQGIFEVKQRVPKKKPKKPAALITDLVLKGQLPSSQCAPLKGAQAATANKKKGPKSVLGQLWGNGKGKFRTSGKYSSATVRGTIWLVQDLCEGTLTKVTRGTVQVRDLKRHKTVTVKAGHSYLARAQRAASKAAGRRK
jgi:Bacterial Ig-like domain